MRLALAQLHPHVGDLDGNVERIAQAYAEGCERGADLVCAPELAVTGYPPEDLLRKPAFTAASERAVHDLASHTGSTALVVGFVEPVGGTDTGTRPVAALPGLPPLANAAAVLREGRVEQVYRKQLLPNYGVFDEARYFRAGVEPLVVPVAGMPVGVTVCEDLWDAAGPVAAAHRAGAALVVNLNASPYHRGKREERESWARHHAARGMTIAYLNAVGGQDEVVFDGDSFVMDPGGTVRARGAQLDTDLVVADVDAEGGVHPAQPPAPRLEPLAETWAALVRGTGDYARKNGFPGALVGVSGGIDSALTAAIAVDALGADAVTCVGMPSPISSSHSRRDARDLAGNLGTGWWELPIEAPLSAFEQVLAPAWEGHDAGLAHENLQSRIRGTLLMSLSNARGDLLLATGNKSEYAVGYATLYGDMAGGFAVLKDVPKLLVFDLARYANDAAGTERIPESTLTKPPSAELRPDQRDTDSLPDYAELDPILEAYVEQDRTVDEIADEGFDRAVVAQVARLVDRSEYKRRQAAPGVKITPRAFGKDRRLPITQAWTR